MAVRRLVCLSICLWLVNTSAAGAVQAPETFDLGALEGRLFQHDNQSLPMAERLTRVERFVFGRMKNGNLGQRIAALKKCLLRVQWEAAIESRLLFGSGHGVVPNGAEAKGTGSKGADISVASQATGSLVVDGTAPATLDSVGEEQSMVGKVGILEQQVFARNFEGDPITMRIHRLENQIYPSIVISKEESLMLQVGRLEDRVREMQASNEIPITVALARPFDEQTYQEDAQSRWTNASKIENDEDLLKEISDLRTLARGIDPYYAGSATGDPGNQPNSSGKSHGFKRAMFDTLRILISGAAYSF